VPRNEQDHQNHPVERIAGIKGVLDYWNAELREAVTEARVQGFSWREISRGLDVTYQATLMRFKSDVEEEIAKRSR
jgi:DNA-directed RNA polymerase specialized sigma24 family protein